MAETAPFRNFFLGVESGPADYGPAIRGQSPDVEMEMGVGELFSRSMESGAEGLGADLDYAGAIFNTFIGREDAAKQNIAAARNREEYTGELMQGIQSFGEFLEAPTFEGFVTQAVKSVGQLTPSAVSTIASAGIGGVTAAVGRGVLSKTGSSAAKRIVNDALTKEAKGIATPEESELAQGMYEYFRKGALAGAFGSEYAPLSGSNLSEALEAGEDLDRGQAARAALIGVPQAAIGVGGEVALLKLMGNVASKRAAKEGGIFARFASDISKSALKGGVIEGTTEVVQEGISVANRYDLDDSFSDEEAQLRLAESAFAGFFGGKAAGAAGGAIGSTVSNIGPITDKVGTIFDKAKTQLQNAQQQRVDSEINDEQFGEPSNQTWREPKSDIDAQVRAMLDPNSGKKAVWVAGEDGLTYFGEDGVKNIDGQMVHTRYIPGRGVIASTDQALVDEVTKSGATDESLSIALGYSNNKTLDGDLVVEVLDQDNNVISAEVTNQDNQQAAFSAAQALVPEGGSVRTLSVEEAAENRKRKVEQEDKSQVREMDLDEETYQQMGYGQRDLSEPDTDQALGEDTIAPEVETEEEVVRAYEPRKRTGSLFKGEEAARSRYIETFGNDERIGSFSQALLQTAVKQQQSYPNSRVTIVKNKEQGSKDFGKWEIRREDFEKLYQIEIDGKRERLTLDEFLNRSVTQAQRAQQKNRNVFIVDENGKKRQVSLATLTNAGRRLVENREGTPFVGERGAFMGLKAGLSEILGDLAIEGYDVQAANGVSLINQDNYQQTETEIAGTYEGRSGRLVKGEKAARTRFTELFGTDERMRQFPLALLETAVQLREKFPNSKISIVQADGKWQLQREFRVEDGAFKGQNLVAGVLGKKPITLNATVGPTGRKRQGLFSRGVQGSEVTAGREDFDPDNTELGDLQKELEGVRDEIDATDIDEIAQLADPEERKEAFREYIRKTDRASYLARQIEEQEGQQQARVITPTISTTTEADISPDRRAGAAPTTGPATATEPEVTPADTEPVATWRDDVLIKKIVDDLIETLPLEQKPLIVSFSEIKDLTDAQIIERFRTEAFPSIDLSIARDIINLRNMMAAKENGSNIERGLHSQGTNVIMIKETGNSLADAMVLSHEIGHSFFSTSKDKAMKNPALRKRLIEAFKKDRNYKTIYEKMGFDVGFEEWYADQIAKWGTKRYLKRQARNLPENHFKRVARALNEMFNKASKYFRQRFGTKYASVDAAFEQYIEGIINQGKQRAKETSTTTTQRTLIPDVVAETKKEGGDAPARAYKRNITKDIAGVLRSVFMPADNILRKVAGNEIADMFYVRAQDLVGRGRLGFLKAVNLTVSEYKNKFERDIGRFDDPDVIDAFKEAAGGTPTAELSGKAKQIREFLEDFYDNYIEPSDTNIGRRDDYFPVALNLFEITQRSEEFKNLIINQAKGITPERAEQAVSKLYMFGQTLQEDGPIDFDPTNPASGVEEAIQLTKDIDRTVLQDAGFLQDPEVAFVEYMRHAIKRIEFNKATGGPDALRDKLQALKPEQAEQAAHIIGLYLGYQKNPVSPLWRSVNSWGQFLQFITILPFATIASLPDLAGPVINSKDFSGLWTGFKEIKRQIQNREEAKQFARDIGVVTSETVANAWVTQAEQDFMNPTVRNLSDKFFQAIGLDYFTKFSREFAAGMGVQFLTKHARNEFNNPNSTRYLQELGITAEEVMAWVEGGRQMSTPEGLKVKQALQRFVESSIMRPNAAERPMWASDPHWALVWQLKGYFYSYYKTIVGGVMNEVGQRNTELRGAAQLSAVSAVLMLTAVATMPLAMLGMELREYAKYGLAWLLPGVEPQARYFRSDRMDWNDYWFEIIEKSGFLGPMSIARMAHQNAEWGNSAIFTLLGPTAETIEEVFQNGWRVDRTISNRLLPIYNQL